MGVYDYKYEVFYPGVYTPEEQEALDRMYEPKQGGPGGPGGAGGMPPMMKQQVFQTDPTNEILMRMYAERIVPDNPLYNDPAYAKNTWYGALPAVPGYIQGMAMGPMLPRELGDMAMPQRQLAGDAYDNEIEYYLPVVAGDKITNGKQSFEVKDVTDPNGSIFRVFVVISSVEMVNQRGEVVGKSTNRMPSMFRKCKEGYTPDARIHPFAMYVHPAHKYTEEDYEKLKAVWKNEKIRGAETLYWDDVKVGDYIWETAEGPFTQLESIRLHGQELVGCRSIRENLMSGHMRGEMNPDGLYLNYITHYDPTRNSFYNYTARDYIVRTITNWMGDQGFLTRINWRMVNDYVPELQANPFPEGFYRESYLLKVPELKAKGAFINTHGWSPDCSFNRGYIYDKYEKDGKYYVDIACWCQDMDGNYLSEVGVTVCLPKK